MPDNLWTHNLALSDFLTGLVFFLMGFVILLQFFQYNKRSNLKLISTVWLLAVFGLLHGLAKWLNFFLTFIFFDITANSFHTWQTITVVITALSFIFLYLFGVELLVHTFKRFHYLRFTALIATFLWASIFLVSYHQENPVWLKQSTAWSYFLLAFPGAILVSLALITQIKDFTRLNIPKLSNAVYGATVSFTLYAVSTGAVFPVGRVFS